ncbi:hypothetical protein CKO44_05835 [Rubrivivax gelatinosus]|uniref:DUF3313 family protein n=1 Tax=Rubrivivax gelatinosus TaxID=28068 RepID=UPI0019061432|nr:DUF3313 family protein [Rubrivivax gelatinosus]MBK1612992.1 hypothetical protein [Rubrivivax gelatinosus]
MKTLTRLAATAVCIAALSACGTVMPTADSGYLSDYRALLPAADASGARRAAAQALDPARVTIDEVVWRADARTDLGDDERQALLAGLERELRQAVQALPPAPEGRPARIRAAITRVETVSPGLNTVGTLLLIGPLDRGGAAFEIEAVDAATGEQLAALRLGYFAPLGELKARFSRLAPAGIAAHEAAVEFAALLQPAGASPAGALPR